jgi:hypothetical protein
MAHAHLSLPASDHDCQDSWHGGSIVHRRELHTFIQLADSVIRLCKDCIKAIKDAPKDMQMIIGEVTSLKAIIESVSTVDLHVNAIKSVPVCLRQQALSRLADGACLRFTVFFSGSVEGKVGKIYFC